MQGVSIVDIRNLIRTIRNEYNFDFGNYAISALRIKVMLFIKKRQLKGIRELMLRLETDPVFYDEFLNGISTPSTEAFRDVEMWLILRNRIFPQLSGLFNPVEILLPDMADGIDLFSILILLQQLDWPDRVKITVTSVSNKSLNLIKDGEFNNYGLETGRDNYQKLGFPGKLDDFIIRKNNHYLFDPALLKNVCFLKQSPDFSSLSGTFHLVFFMNKLINYSCEFQSVVLNKVTSLISKGGFLVLGASENILDFNIRQKNLKEVDEREMVFHKF